MNSPHTRASKSGRSTRLALQRLEDRCTPASAFYAAATQTLTVNAAEGNFIEVAQLASQPTGFIQVSDGSTVFDSSVNVQPVRNLIVRFNGVNNGGLTLLPRLRLAGDVSVIGAMKTQGLASYAEIGGNFTYTATANAIDSLTFFSTSRVGSNMKLDLRGGHNTVSLRGGNIGGRLAVTGTTGADRIELTENSNLRVGGSSSFVLGDGRNEVVGMGAHEFDVGQSVTFKGGSDDDVFDMGQTLTGDLLTALRVAGNFAATLGSSTDILVGNQVVLNFANIGGNFNYSGGANADKIEFSNDLILGGDCRASMGDGGNFMSLRPGGILGHIISGNVYYTGGT